MVKHLIKLNDIKEEPKIYNLSNMDSVTLNGAMFPDGLVSKIEVKKYKTRDNNENIFIKLYMGNIVLATVVTNDDYVIDVEGSKHPFYNIRKAKEFDYRRF